MPEFRIESLADSRLDIFRDLKDNNSTRDLGLFLAEGTTVSRRVFESDFEVHCVLISDRKWDSFGHHIPPHLPIYRLRTELAQQLVGYRFHAGVITAGYRKPIHNIRPLIDATEDNCLFVVAPHLTDPQNVGSLIRIAACFGATAAIFGQKCTDPFSRRALRVSMGNGLFLPVVETDALPRLLERMREEWGFTISATVLADDAISIHDARRPRRHAIIFGHETDGIGEEYLQPCDQRVTIPMQMGTDSLNVAVSAGIFLYEFTKGT